MGCLKKNNSNRTSEVIYMVLTVILYSSIIYRNRWHLHIFDFGSILQYGVDVY